LLRASSEIAEKEGSKIKVDINKLGPIKVLGKGLVTHPFNLHANLITEKAKEKIDRYCHEVKLHGISFNSPPLLRFCCFSLSAKSHLLIITYHHIILDGWSISLLIQEFLLRYRNNQIISTSFSYIDYINYYERLDHSLAKSYWKSTLPKDFSVEEPIQLPQLGMSNGKNYPYEQYVCTLPKSIVKNLSNIAARLKVTLSTLFQAAWAIILHFYIQHDDIVYGTTASGRHINLPDIEKAVGVFINTFPVILKIRSNTTIEELILLLHQQITGSIPFSYYPLDKIMRKKDIGEGFFKTLLVYENYPAEIKENNQLSIEISRSFDPTHYPITIIIYPRKKFKLCIQYEKSMYTKLQMTTMLSSFIEALKHTYTSNEKNINTRLSRDAWTHGIQLLDEPKEIHHHRCLLP